MTIPEFDNPHALWLALLIPVYLIGLRRRRTTSAVRYPSVRNLQRLPRSLRQRFRFVMRLLEVAALLLLIVALARPIRQLEYHQMPSQGIAIAMVVDRSGSMANRDGQLMYEGELALRIDVARDACQDFIVGDGEELPGRPNDLIGLITFATYPQTDHPFSLDHTSLRNVAERMAAELPFLDEFNQPTGDRNKAAPQVDEQGRPLRTMLGQTAPRPNPMQYTDLKKAIEYTANRLVLLEQDLDRAPGDLEKYNLQSKVMMLLTDGEPTVADARRAPDYPDEQTIELLTEAGIRVYTIQILSQQRYRERPDGTVEVIGTRRRGLFGSLQSDRDAALVNQAIEEARRMARRTGGEHFLATSGDQIKEVYARIDELERSDVGGRTVFSHEERYRPYVWAAVIMLAAQALLGLTWLRRAP